ncbi:MAG TPA: branched-chain amino acid ABC transporter substrate-binding protein [Acidimicrobiia bacterium]|nr:branched-chain amino acid ABC transporter substrate-binding protein [Acidimicrobiia bacterium]
MRAKLGLLITVFALGVAACGGDDPKTETAGKDNAGDARETVKIGALVPLSGDNARFGTEMLNAAQLAADDLNASNGVLGRQIEIVSGDDRCDPDAAGPAADQLAMRGIVGVAGGYCSGAAVPASAALDAKGLPYISAYATNPAVTDRGLQTVFRLPGRDDQQAAFAARFLAGPGQARKLAILHNNTLYASYLAERTRSANDELKLGMQIVFFDDISPGQPDYRSTLTAIKSSGADTLYYAGYQAEASVILRQAKELALPARIVGSDATADPSMIDATGAAAEGFVATAALVPELLPRAGTFIQAYTQRFGAQPGPSGVYEYDAVRTLANAIFWAGSTDPKDIIEALRTTRHEGLIGEIAFDAKGDRQSTLYTTAIVRDGKFRPHKKLDARDNWVDG